MNRRKSNKSLIMYTWERPGKLSTSPKWLKPSLKYHLQLKTKEDVGGSGLGLQGGGRKWSVHACVPSSFRCVRFFVILWTVACQVPLSMGLSRQECWGGLPCPPPGNLPDPGIKPMSSVSLALASGFYFTMEIEKQMFGKQMFAEPAETMGHREDPDF